MTEFLSKFDSGELTGLFAITGGFVCALTAIVGGLVLVVSPYYADSIRHQFTDCGLDSWHIGQVTSGPRSVRWA